MNDFLTTDGEEITAEMQAKMAEKIGKLIAMSEDDSLGAEARATYAEKAEKLMRQYRVDEENVVASGDSGITPIRYEIVLVEGMGKYYASEFQDAYLRIWQEIRKHAELRGHAEYRWDEQGGARSVVAVGYGYEMDIRLAQFLWTSAHLTFATRIDTKVNKSLSDQLNCYFMRGSGMERNDIAEMLWGSARTDGAAHGKVQKLYLAECAAREEQPSVGGKGFQAARYRKAYADGFVDEFGWRLRDARSAVDASSGTMLLKGRAERIAEAYYAEWPEKAPATPEEQAARKARSEQFWAEQAAEEAACLASGACAAARKRALAKVESECGRTYLHQVELDRALCKRHRPTEVTAAQQARWHREANAPERTAGRRAGSAAASSVAFRRTAGERAQKAPTAQRTALEG